MKELLDNEISRYGLQIFSVFCLLVSILRFLRKYMDK